MRKIGTGGYLILALFIGMLLVLSVACQRPATRPPGGLPTAKKEHIKIKDKQGKVDKDTVHLVKANNDQACWSSEVGACKVAFDPSTGSPFANGAFDVPADPASEICSGTANKNSPPDYKYTVTCGATGPGADPVIIID